MLNRKYQGMRILLRHGEDYLQPSGEWTKARATAKEFPSSTFAYYWALEKRLLGVEVLLAFEDATFDVVAMRAYPSGPAL